MRSILCALMCLTLLVSHSNSEEVDQVEPEKLARVKIGDRYGFINTKGRYVINPQFDDALWFSEGLARIKVGDKYGFIDTKGEIVINPQFDGPWWFSEGLARVKIGEKWGFIDTKGAIVINPQFDEAGPFKTDDADLFELMARIFKISRDQQE